MVVRRIDPRAAASTGLAALLTAALAIHLHRPPPLQPGAQGPTSLVLWRAPAEPAPPVEPAAATAATSESAARPQPEPLPPQPRPPQPEPPTPTLAPTQVEPAVPERVVAATAVLPPAPAAHEIPVPDVAADLPRPIAVQEPVPVEPMPAPASAMTQTESPPPLPTADASPVLPQAERPLLPSERFVPGGPVMVLAILVDSQGRVRDIAIKVPSKHPLSDVGLAFAAMRSTYSKIDPPLAPGESRWVEEVVFYTPAGTVASRNTPEDILP